MKPGDLVVCRPEYTEASVPPVGVILEEANLKWHAEVVRFNVLFPEGIFPMYSYEIELLAPAPEIMQGA